MTRILVDVSWVCKGALYKDVKSDPNHQTLTDITGKALNIASADWAFIKALETIANNLKVANLAPKDLILVRDSRTGSSFRRSWLPTYKAGRVKCDGVDETYNKVESMFLEHLLSLGAIEVMYEGLEADDAIAFFARELQSSITLSGDLDSLANLQYDGASRLHNYTVSRENVLGDFPPEFIDVYKATVGDTSDKIPGAKGFGPKAFMKVYNAFGDKGMKALRYLIETRRLAELRDDVAKVPELQRLIDSSDVVHTSLKVAKMYPDRFDWRSDSMKVKVGKLATSGVVALPMQSWAYHEYVTDNVAYDSHMAKLAAILKSLPAGPKLVSLDFETAGGDESKEWCAQTPDGDKMVDVLGAELVTVQISLGSNMQHAFLLPLNLRDCANISLDQLSKVYELLDSYNVKYIIQNAQFELTVHYNTFKKWLPSVLDTKILSGYVDENLPTGLKQNSKHWLNYDQTSYEDTVRAFRHEVVQFDSEDELTGEVFKAEEVVEVPFLRTMDELTVEEVIEYGLDDVICTAALFNWYHLVTSIEKTWETYLKVETGVIYWIAQAYQDGMNVSKRRLSEMTRADAEKREAFRREFDDYLISIGWDGSVLTETTPENLYTPAHIKYLVSVVTGGELKTAVRKFEKLCDAVEEIVPQLADLLRSADCKAINTYVSTFFTGRPTFNMGSPKQKVDLLYNHMGLPIRNRKPPTEIMRRKGLQGSPEADALAIKTAIKMDLDADKPEDAAKIKALNAMVGAMTIDTRFGLFYETYPRFLHWKDGKLHPNFNQNAAATGRATSSKVNAQQMNKGKDSIRTCIVPHHKRAVIVSLDFSAQELRMIADYSNDPQMVSCYIGENLRDMHSLTGAGIAEMDYAEFEAARADAGNAMHKIADACRKLGKTVNFSTEFGAQAPKLARMLLIPESDAQRYIDIKEETFAVASAWKQSVIEDAKVKGFATTKLGRRRHLPVLRDPLGDRWDKLKAARQAVNFKIQGSSAEQTKLAMAEMWKSKMRERFDMQFYAQIHDEVVASICIDDLFEALPEMHACMTQQYADMFIPCMSSVAIGLDFGGGLREMEDSKGNALLPTRENLTNFINSHEELAALVA